MKKPRGVFVTGTDTGVGKTVISSLLAKSLKKFTSLQYYKPIQTGYLEDDDTLTVARRAELTPQEIIEPAYRLIAPQSPNRAAVLENVDISLENVLSKLNTPHFLVVEGAGGLEVPIREQTRMSDLVKAMDLPLVVVASTRLGTINHTLLTCQRARLQGITVLGVILSGPEDVGLREVLEEQGERVLFSIPFLESEKDWLAAEAIVDENKDLFFEFPWEDLRAKDKEMIWHPFTQHNIVSDHTVITRAQGAHFYFENGKKVLDGISSWWVNVVGHSHPVVALAIAQQAHSLEHVIFAGFTHKPAVQVSENVLGELQTRYDYLKKVFFSDNGSTAVEVALKMAFQYASLKGEHQRTKFMALRGSYHGDTLGAMSVGEPDGFHTYFKPLMMPVDYLNPDNFLELEEFAKTARNYAACIVEPLIQGAGGMRIYSSEYLEKLAQICKDNGVLLISDEIFTGFYRTGTFLASYQTQIQPDLICLSKGLTGGFLPLALTVTTQKIYDAFLSDHIQTAFLHGHSYTGNPMACAAAHATFGLLQSKDMQQRISQLVSWTAEEINKLRGLDLVENPRSLGTIGAFDVAGYKGYFTGSFAETFSQKCIERGIYVKPLGGTIYTVPPYCVNEQEFRYMYQVIRETLFDLRK